MSRHNIGTQETQEVRYHDASKRTQKLPQLVPEMKGKRYRLQNNDCEETQHDVTEYKHIQEIRKYMSDKNENITNEIGHIKKSKKF